MGLDISVFRKVTFVREMTEDEDEGDDWQRRCRISANPDFVERFDGMKDGLYEVSGDYERASSAKYEGGEPDPDRLHFRAGSYSGYSWWRSHLAKLAGYSAEHRGSWDVPAAGPFVELVNFSDCEGAIGPKTSAKLAKDFADWQERADAYSVTIEEDGAWFASQYALWRKAFEMAAGEGVVDFH
jgi:hypothetical protein